MPKDTQPVRRGPGFGPRSAGATLPCAAGTVPYTP